LNVVGQKILSGSSKVLKINKNGAKMRLYLIQKRKIILFLRAKKPTTLKGCSF